MQLREIHQPNFFAAGLTLKTESSERQLCAPRDLGGESCSRFSRRSRRRGFTFTEILFAVLILGIGFILVAAIFPVAIRQTQISSEETSGSTIGKGAVAYLEKQSTQTNWYTTGQTLPDGLVHCIGPVQNPGDPIATNTTLWPLISGNLILPTDPRYAWVAMYRQGTNPNANPANSTPLPYLQLIVIGVQARNQQQYGTNDITGRTDASNVTLATLQPRALTATFSSQTITFAAIASQPNNINCVAEGAYVVVAADSNSGATNGWIVRLGTNQGGSTWSLAPGSDLTGATTTPGAGSVVYVIGAGYADSNLTTTNYTGPAQDVGAYTTFITVH